MSLEDRANWGTMSDQMAKFRADRDAFGHMLLDQLDGREAVEIIEQEDGFIIASMKSRRYFSEYRDWDPVEQEAMRWLAARPAAGPGLRRRTGGAVPPGPL